jgi:hypothetical protein
MVKLPYREEGNPPILRPTVDIRLTCGPTGEWTTRALIDTGNLSNAVSRNPWSGRLSG